MLCMRYRSRLSSNWVRFTVKYLSLDHNLEIKTCNKQQEFSQEEQSKILYSLNGRIEQNLSKLNIPQNQIKKLENWRSKKGPFSSMNDILDAEGMDVKQLVKICRSVVQDKPVRNSNQLNNIKHRQIISPNLPSDKIGSLSSVVGLHLGPAGISWAKLSCDAKNLDYWGFKDFSNLPAKPSSMENFNLALGTLDDIPAGDVYIFEALPSLPLQAQANLGPVFAYIQQLEFNSMLLALLNTSETHNKFINKDSIQKQNENIVYYLKAKLAARLFQTWVGTEKVSAITTVQQFFEDTTKVELPCTPIQIRSAYEDAFNSLTSVHKELMSQALLLSVAFLDLCILKNPKSLKAIAPSKK